MKHYQIKQNIIYSPSNNIYRYFHDIKKYPLLSEEEFYQLLKIGDKKSKDKIVKSNLRFVISIAKQYQNRGIDLEDLISVGNIGLIEAVNKFKESFNVHFTTYASWWIRSFILNELITNGNLIRLPKNKIYEIHQINKEIIDFVQIHNRPPTSEELSKKLSIPEELVNELLKYSNIKIITDASDTDSNEYSLFDTIPNEIESQNNVNFDKLYQILESVLKPREIEILLQSFGFNEGLTIKEISENII